MKGGSLSSLRNRFVKTRIFLFLFIAFTYIFKSNGQVPNWVWAKSAGGNSYDLANSVSTDESGNILIAGFFQSSSITFGSIVLTNDTTDGSADIFIVKYDAGGNIQWAKSGGGSLGDRAFSLTIDTSGNIYMAGSFHSDSIIFDSAVLKNAGGSDMFLVKYDANGNVLWAKSAGNNSNDYATSIICDAPGNILVVGDFYGDSIIFGSTILINSGVDNVFIAKYDANGNVLWAKSAGGSGGSQKANSVTTNISGKGNIYVVGYFYSKSIIFGYDTLTNSDTNIYSGTTDMFIVKYDTDGNEIWAKSAGGNFLDAANSVATDASDNIFITGYFSSNPIIFSSDTLNNNGMNDIFMVKYDSTGNMLWAKSFGSNDYDYANSVNSDASGNIILVGGFKSSSISFDSVTLFNSNSGIDDMFIVKFNSFGNVLWAKSTGSTGYDFALSATTDISDNIFVIGIFTSSFISFGSAILTNDSAGTFDLFLAKIGTATSIEENNGNQKFIYIYPNPTTGKFQISGIQYPESNVEIYNALGKMICQSDISYLKSEIDLSKYPPGIYFIKLFTAEKTYTEKLIKQ